MIYTDKIHLVADTLNELHDFCVNEGIKRCWFEGVNRGHPHYDIPKHKKYIIEYDFVKKITSKQLLLISKKLIKHGK